ncbi:hypothetical protein N7456_005514 [Penicillium angulare]|uniref:Uncharacterized protein n=1 Tax=Penicillium angulare TaxID=116970 RepID=A0A9W9KJE5_9EURO|nr:hypothetical protein N7456_005514 [Penicillium angulare]
MPTLNNDGAPDLVEFLELTVQRAYLSGVGRTDNNNLYILRQERKLVVDTANVAEELNHMPSVLVLLPPDLVHLCTGLKY